MKGREQNMHDDTLSDNSFDCASLKLDIQEICRESRLPQELLAFAMQLGGAHASGDTPQCPGR